MSNDREIWEWKKEMDEQPRIWFTLDRDNNPVNFYESKDAALVELRWMKSRQHMGRVSIGSAPIHSLDLSQRRWREPKQQ